MQFSGEAIILSVHKFAEHGAVVRVFGREHGVYSGICNHALSKAQRGTFQVGNCVHASWNARLQEHLGTLSAELTTPIAALIMQDRHLLRALGAISRLCLDAMHEHDPHPVLYDAARDLLMQMALGEEWLADYVRFELLLLAETGFGLDLGQCAATGREEDLIYVSPKSGCAVSREAGAPYADRLLPLPAFVRDETMRPTPAHVAQGLQLTGYFLHHWLLEPHGKRLPDERERLAASLMAAPHRMAEDA